MGAREDDDYTLVVRKPCFDLPTACPACLPVYFYLKFARLPFHLDFNLLYPDSGKIPLPSFIVLLIYFLWLISPFSCGFAFGVLVKSWALWVITDFCGWRIGKLACNRPCAPT